VRRFLPSLFAAIALILAGPAAASAPTCTPGPNWSSSWTGAGQTTTYTISAPPCVYVNVPFNVTLTVTDSFYNAANGYPTATVGMKFSVLDTTVNGTVTLPGSSGDTVTVEDGLWVHTFSVTYPTLVVNHALQFQFVDFGDAISQGMWWTFSTTSAGGTTLDPYPPGSEPPVEPPPVEPPPVVDPIPTDPPAASPTADPATGCATSGAEAGLAAFLALALGARRRRP
jgi:hypothetical protein